MLTRPRKWIIVLAATVQAVLGTAAHADTLQQVLNRGSLRVGVTLAEPWAFRNDERELRGFEIDVARQLAADMDVSVEFVFYDFDRLIAGLEAGEVDLIASGLAITADRARHVNFSNPYAIGGVGIATNIAATADVERLEDFNSAGYTVAVLRSSVAAELARRLLPRAELVEFRSEEEAALALVSGDADIYLDQEPAPRFLALEYPRIVDVPLNRPLLESRFGFAVAKGDPDFVFYLNAWIEAREADTWLPTTHRYWFETLQWQD
ncbi:MAG: transporter substrate-binding domain-containing protein [Gammaproteobacteria bacterium]|nr:transporter substrate-binding domain-containing protein [Gammaproteobacteria bacterium]